MPGISELLCIFCGHCHEGSTDTRTTPGRDGGCGTAAAEATRVGGRRPYYERQLMRCRGVFQTRCPHEQAVKSFFVYLSPTPLPCRVTVVPPRRTSLASTCLRASLERGEPQHRRSRAHLPLRLQRQLAKDFLHVLVRVQTVARDRRLSSDRACKHLDLLLLALPPQKQKKDHDRQPTPPDRDLPLPTRVSCDAVRQNPSVGDGKQGAHTSNWRYWAAC